MSALSTILAEIETSAEKMKSLEAERAAEKEHGKGLVEQYRSLSGEALKLLGIESSRKDRRPKSNEAVLMGVANRTIRKLVQGGEKNTKILLAAATEAAEQTAEAKLGLTELPTEIKQQIDEKVTGLGKTKVA